MWICSFSFYPKGIKLEVLKALKHMSLKKVQSITLLQFISFGSFLNDPHQIDFFSIVCFRLFQECSPNNENPQTILYLVLTFLTTVLKHFLSFKKVIGRLSTTVGTPAALEEDVSLPMTFPYKKFDLERPAPLCSSKDTIITHVSLTLLSDNWHNSSPLPPAKLQTRRLCFAAIIRSKSPDGTEFRRWFLNCVREMHSSSLPSQALVFTVGTNMFVTFDLQILIKMEWGNDIRIMLNQKCIFFYLILLER